ncbi:MAG: NAD-dependent epimerase [Planctomycetota bacterium]
MIKETTDIVTGVAGFIGFHVAKRLLEQDVFVIGVDNVNSYYDVRLKEARLEQLKTFKNFSFHRLDLTDYQSLQAVFTLAAQRVIHLAAQAGVRYSLVNPQAYVQSNLSGFLNILECCRHAQIKHLVFASSSSVYGSNTRMPFSTHDNVDHPLSLYAATKKANELMAHSYAHLYRLPCTGLRFFTVYGPWGRPDMAAFIFSKAILEGRPIKLFNEGRMIRDFTYIDDIAEGVARTLEKIPQPNPQWQSDAPDPATSLAPYKVYNIGNHQPVELLRFVEILETEWGRKAEKHLLPMEPGDVPMSFADTDDLARDVGFSPHTPIETGLKNFVRWYREFYKLQ